MPGKLKILLLALALASPLYAGSYLPGGVTQLSDSLRREILQGDFQIVSEVAALPREAVALFEAEASAPAGPGTAAFMANPGEAFQVTDLILDPPLPPRRLIFAAVNDRLCLVHYERGGIALSYHLVAVPRSPSDTTQVWHAASPIKLESLFEARRAIGGNLVDDSPFYRY